MKYDYYAPAPEPDLTSVTIPLRRFVAEHPELRFRERLAEALAGGLHMREIEGVMNKAIVELLRTKVITHDEFQTIYVSFEWPRDDATFWNGEIDAIREG